MTRATLLHVLDRPTALGPAEVRELEQLAQAFPYCQTAHLLLAKAAHDQGTMLAGQRLRRAATYAADRALLRRLIEQVEPATATELLPEPEAAATPPESEAHVLLPEAPSAPSVPVAEVAAAPNPTAAEAFPAIVGSLPALPVAEAVASEPEKEPETAPAVAEAVPAVVPEPVDEATEQTPEVVAELVAAEQLPVESEVDLLVLVDQEGASIPAVEAIPAPEYTPEIGPEDEETLRAQAPAIRPSEEVGEARFEFGLAEQSVLVSPTYELPGLVDEWAAAAVTLSLGSPELLLSAAATASVESPVFTPAAFTGDVAVGYSFSESSRLGFSMQLLDLLTAKAETVESITAVVAAAQPPATALPPCGAFFEPDPLLLDHWATHCPPPPALPSSLDLINNFLRRQPRLTRPAMLPPAATHQADLSVRSTRAEPDLVSENLARIFVRQGKTARAIEIYEKLMVKQPEKMVYFAAQIEELKSHLPTS